MDDLRREREVFLTVRSKGNEFSRFEKLARKNGASDSYIEWYKEFRGVHAHLDCLAQFPSRAYELDFERVRHIVERTSWHRLYDPLDDVSTWPDVLKAGLVVGELFHHTFDYLPPDYVLELFEQPDMTELSRRALQTELVKSEELTTLDELATLASEFITYLENNRESLIAIGLPRTSFERSFWLARLLGNLYYVKFPTRVRKRWPAKWKSIEGWIVAKNVAVELLYEYKWAKHKEFVDPSLRFADMPSVSYEEAEFLPGLSPAELEFITEMRGKLLDLKLAILSAVVDSLQQRDAEKLRGKGIQLIRDSLTAEEFNACVHLDGYYEQRNPDEGSTLLRTALGLNAGKAHNAGWDADRFDAPYNLSHEAGGLGDTLWALWEFEQELQIGTRWRMRDALGELVRTDHLGSTHLDTDNYLAVVDPRRRESVDNALDLYTKLKRQARASERSFVRYLRENLCEAYKDGEVMVRYNLRRGSASAIEIKAFGIELVGKISEAVSAVFRATRDQETASETAAPNVFQKEGNYWTVAFRGKRGFVKNLHGMHHIRRLLAEPGEGFAAVHLDSLLSRSDGGEQEPPCPETSPEEALASGLTIRGPGDGGEAYDQRAEEDLERRAEEFRNEAVIREQTGDQAGAKELRDEAEQIERYLRTGMDIHGRPRKLDDKGDMIRKRVANSIDYAVKAIEKDHPELGQHLRNTIHTGYECRYAPDSPLEWEV